MSGLVYEDFANNVVLLKNGQQAIIGDTGAGASGNSADPGDSTFEGGSPVIGAGGDIYFNGGSGDLMVFANNSNFATNSAKDLSINNPNAWSGGLDPQDFVAFDNSVYFVGLDNNADYGLWVTNGTASGTYEVAGSPQDNGQMAVYNGDLYFNGPGGALETYNPSEGFNSIVGSGAPGNPQDMISASYSALWGGTGTDLFMNGVDASGRKDLYAYDGSTFDQIGAKGLNPRDLTAVSTNVPIGGLNFEYNAVYFNGVDAATGKRGLFMADPGDSSLTGSPVSPVTRIAGSSLGGSPYGLNPQDITELNGKVYFAGGDNKDPTDPHAEGLWVYNPATPAVAPKEVVSSANYDLDLNASVLGTLAHPQAQIAASGGDIYFAANQNGLETLFAYNPSAHTNPVSMVSNSGLNPFNMTGV
jgi:hypothetical protein